MEGRDGREEERPIYKYWFDLIVNNCWVKMWLRICLCMNYVINLNKELNE